MQLLPWLHLRQPSHTETLHTHSHNYNTHQHNIIRTYMYMYVHQFDLRSYKCIMQLTVNIALQLSASSKEVWSPSKSPPHYLAAPILRFNPKHAIHNRHMKMYTKNRSLYTTITWKCIHTYPYKNRYVGFIIAVYRDVQGESVCHGVCVCLSGAGKVVCPCSWCTSCSRCV